MIKSRRRALNNPFRYACKVGHFCFQGAALPGELVR